MTKKPGAGRRGGIAPSELKYGDVFKCKDWSEWHVAMGAGTLADPERGVEVYEIPRRGITEKGRLRSDGGFVRVAKGRRVYLNLDLGDQASNRLRDEAKKMAKAVEV